VHRWIVAFAAAALLLPGAAAAKEITAVTVCGAHACTRLTDHADLDAFMHAGGLAEEAPSTPQRSYLVRVRVSEPGVEHPDEWVSRWLPDAGVMASADESSGSLLFTGVDPALEQVLRRGAGAHAAYAPRRFVRRDVQARVDEGAEPAASRAASSAASAADDGGTPSLAFVGAGVLALLAAAGVRRLRRARR
jgi:hypothetical protein